MAWVSQELKKKIATALKALDLPVKYTLAVRHHSTLVFTIRQAPMSWEEDFVPHANMHEGALECMKCMDVNIYHVDKLFKGEALKTLNLILSTIKKAGDWFDKSDTQTDYFHTAFYIDVRFGSYGKPCEFVKPVSALKIAPTTLAPEPVATNRDRMISRIKASMVETRVGALLSENAIQALAEAAVDGMVQ